MSDILDIYKNRLNLMQKNKEYAEFVRIYGFDRCHYLTKALSEHLNRNDIVIFYMSKSDIIAHSAVLLDGLAVDAHGKQRIEDIEAGYDSHFQIMQTSSIHGSCKHFITTVDKLEMDHFYNKPLGDFSPVKKEVKKWFDHNGNLLG